MSALSGLLRLWLASSVPATGWLKPATFSGAPMSGVGRARSSPRLTSTSPKLDQILAAYQELPIVRAVRQPLYWADDPLRRLGAHPDFLSDAAWLRGFESVAATDLTWDLLVYDEQLPAAEELLRSFPSTASPSRPPAGRWIKPGRIPSLGGTTPVGRRTSASDLEAAGPGTDLRPNSQPRGALGQDGAEHLRCSTLHVRQPLPGRSLALVLGRDDYCARGCL